MVRKEGKGYRLYSRSKPGRALGPVRSSKAEVMHKDEKRVQYFKRAKARKKA